MEWIICLGVGAVGGTLSSMLGAGNGYILIPGLALAFAYAGIGGPDTLKIAIATTHAANVFLSVSMLHAHAAKSNVDWTAFWKLAPGIATGAVLGGLLTGFVPARVVAIVFASVALLVAWRIIRKSHPSATMHRPLPRSLTLSSKGVGIGCLAGLAGFGGLTAPLLSSYMAMRKAIGTSAAITLPITIPASLTYALLDGPPDCGRNCLGFVYLPAVGAVGLTAVLAAPLGVWLSQIVPIVALRRILATILVCVALNLGANVIPDGKLFQAEAKQMWAEIFPSSPAPVEAAEAPVWLRPKIISPWAAKTLDQK